MWPIVGLGPDGWEGAVVGEFDEKADKRQITEWHAEWLERKFPVDMNAFCFNTALLQVKGPASLHVLPVACPLLAPSRPCYPHPAVLSFLMDRMPPWCIPLITGRAAVCDANHV